ncbi:hypothetical protein BJX65DRAFT_233963 [Aspergillus insuetus]
MEADAWLWRLSSGLPPTALACPLFSSVLQIGTQRTRPRKIWPTDPQLGAELPASGSRVALSDGPFDLRLRKYPLSHLKCSGSRVKLQRMHGARLGYQALLLAEAISFRTLRDRIANHALIYACVCWSRKLNAHVLYLRVKSLFSGIGSDFLEIFGGCRVTPHLRTVDCCHAS